MPVQIWDFNNSVDQNDANNTEMQTIQLTNGNILTAYVSDHAADHGSPAGTDIFAIIHDPFGNVVRSEFRLNNHYSDGNEKNFNLTALSDGGFAIAYFSNEIGSDLQHIAAEAFDHNGDQVAGDAITSRVHGQNVEHGNTFIRNVHIAESGGGADDLLLVFESFIPDAGDSSRGEIRVISREYDLIDGVFRGFHQPNVSLSYRAEDVNDWGHSQLSVTGQGDGTYLVAYARDDDLSGFEGFRELIDFDNNVFGYKSYDDESGSISNFNEIDYLFGDFQVIATEQSLQIIDSAHNTITDKFSSFDRMAMDSDGLRSFAYAGYNAQKNQLTVRIFDSTGLTSDFEWDTLSEKSIILDEHMALPIKNILNLDILMLGDGRVQLSWAAEFDDQPVNVYSVILDSRENDEIYVAYSSHMVVGTTGDDVLDAVQGEIFHGGEGRDEVKVHFSHYDSGSFYGGIGTDILNVGEALNHTNNLNLDLINHEGFERLSFGDTGRDDLRAEISVQNLEQFNEIAGGGELRVNLNGETDVDLSGISNLDGKVDIHITGGESAVTILLPTVTPTFAQSDAENRWVSYIVAGGGDDVVMGGLGRDNLNGQHGNDELRGGLGNDILYGGSGNDRLFGDEGNDQIRVQSGDDIAEGGAGNDLIYGSTGNNILRGNEGDDSFYFDDDVDVAELVSGQYLTAIDGGEGRNVLYFTSQRGFEAAIRVVVDEAGQVAAFTNGTTQVSLDGSDHQFVRADNVVSVRGTDHSDIIVNNAIDTRMWLYAGAGDDEIIGTSALENEFLYGDGGDDVIRGNGGAGDTLSGGNGNDVLYSGQTERSFMFGWERDDLRFMFPSIRSEDQFDTWVPVNSQDEIGLDDLGEGQTDNDIFHMQGNWNFAFGGAGNDIFYGNDGYVNIMLGGQGDDVFHLGNGDHNRAFGGMGADVFHGSDVDDYLNGGAGADQFNGGGGIDTVSYEGANADLAFGVEVNLSSNQAEGGDAEDDSFADIENLIGSDFNDQLTGTDGVNRILGGAGDDVLRGLLGDDHLEGGDGEDILEGNEGNDTLVGETFGDILRGGYDDDTYHISVQGVRIEEDEDAGFDEVFSSVTYYLADHIEKATLTGDQAISLVGNRADNILIGNSGNNIFTGFGGNNRIDGGEGSDVASYIYASTQFAQIKFNDLVVVIAKDGSQTDRMNNIDSLLFTDQTIQTDGLDEFGVLEYVASFADLIDVFGTDEDAAFDHYVANGYREGREVTFSGMEYIASHADLIDAFGTNKNQGASHYVQFGFGEGRGVTFDGLQYIASHADLIQSIGLDAEAGAAHYIEFGHSKNAATDFNALEYIAAYSDLMDAFGSDTDAAIAHYIQTGYGQNRDLRFDGLEYLASHADLMAAFGTDVNQALHHYIGQGYEEGRMQTFDSLNYIASNDDLITAFGTDGDAAALHYIQNGRHEGRATDLFDALLYIGAHDEALAEGETNIDTALEFYLNHGVRRGHTRDDFSGLEYIASYADLSAAFGTNAEAAVDHFRNWGYGEGRRVSFDGLEYIASHADLIGVFGINAEAGAQHYIGYGQSEGRTTTFDSLAYIASHSDLIEALGANETAGALHYIQEGRGAGRNVTFDAQAYLDGNAALADRFGDDLEAATIYYIEEGYENAL